MNNGNSFGPNFNAVGGGWFVMERTDDAIRVWFWERNDPNVPASIKNRQDSLLSEELVRALVELSLCNYLTPSLGRAPSPLPQHELRLQQPFWSSPVRPFDAKSKLY